MDFQHFSYAKSRIVIVLYVRANVLMNRNATAIPITVTRMRNLVTPDIRHVPAVEPLHSHVIWTVVVCAVNSVVLIVCQTIPMTRNVASVGVCLISSCILPMILTMMYDCFVL